MRVRRNHTLASYKINIRTSTVEADHSKELRGDELFMGNLESVQLSPETLGDVVLVTISLSPRFD